MLHNQCGLCLQKAKISKKAELLPNDLNAGYLDAFELQIPV